jgi:alpha-amylase
LGFAGMLAEGWPTLVGNRNVGQMFSAARGKIKVLLRHFGFSDDIAFRFSDRSWPHYPLRAETFADWLAASDEEVVNLFMDYETFGEHQSRETGIFDFMAALPRFTQERGVLWKRPSELIGRRTVAALDAPNVVSWADTERDASAWLGNAMQTTSMQALWSMEAAIKKKGDATLLRDWRRMTSSDHPYYMSTKYLADGAVHQHFSPYESPYDAYINFNNVLDNLGARARETNRPNHDGTTTRRTTT